MFSFNDDELNIIFTTQLTDNFMIENFKLLNERDQTIIINTQKIPLKLIEEFNNSNLKVWLNTKNNTYTKFKMFEKLYTKLSFENKLVFINYFTMIAEKEIHPQITNFIHRKLQDDNILTNLTSDVYYQVRNFFLNVGNETLKSYIKSINLHKIPINTLLIYYHDFFIFCSENINKYFNSMIITEFALFKKLYLKTLDTPFYEKFKDVFTNDNFLFYINYLELDNITIDIIKNFEELYHKINFNKLKLYSNEEDLYNFVKNIIDNNIPINNTFYSFLFKACSKILNFELILKIYKIIPEENYINMVYWLRNLMYYKTENINDEILLKIFKKILNKYNVKFLLVLNNLPYLILKFIVNEFNEIFLDVNEYRNLSKQEELIDWGKNHETGTCYICYIENIKLLTFYNCSHQVCKNCIKQINTPKICPFCRNILISKSKLKICID